MIALFSRCISEIVVPLLKTIYWVVQLYKVIQRLK